MHNTFPIKCFLLFFIYSLGFHSIASAQGTVNGPKTICLGDLKGFSYTAPSGSTVIGLNWNFGDGYTTTGFGPTHTYAAVGKFTIVVNASFSNGSSAIDSLRLEVFGLPKVKFFRTPNSDTCWGRNNVCILDTSSEAAAGQSLYSRMIVWGDGSFQADTFPKKNDSFCHHFPVVASYNTRLEITDTYGCKNSYTQKVTILENIKSDFIINDTWVNCTTARVFVINKSTGVPASRSHYRWYADTSALDTGFYFTSEKNVYYDASRTGKITLISFGNNACRDTLTQNFSIIVDTLSNEITLSDTVMCNGATTLLDCYFPKVSMDSIVWYKDNFPPPIAPPLPIPKEFDWHYDVYHTGIGKHQIKVKVFRGSCIHTVTKDYTLTGPLPVIFPIDYVQCVGARKVYLIENTQGSKREDCLFRWRIEDPYGENCTHIQAQDSNLYTNCNRSEDWYMKHQFKNSIKSTYPVYLWVRDTVLNCEDSTVALVLINNCGPILNFDTFHMCGGKTFIDNANSPFPESFTLDTGKTWLRFPIVLDTSYHGIYELGFIFKSLITPWAEDFGNDSIKIHKDTLIVWDTIYRNQKLWVHGPKEDDVTFKVYGKCKPYHISVHLKNGWFEEGEKLIIEYGGNSPYYKTFDSLTHVDSVMFTYQEVGLSVELQVRLESKWGCFQVTKFFVERGKTFNMYTKGFMNCISDTVCLNANVYDIKTHKYWPGNTDTNKVKWWFPREKRLDTSYFACFKFSEGGMQPMHLIAMDANGCIDTVFDTVFIQDVRANIKSSSQYIYCSELKQFFDSSSYLLNPEYHKFFQFYIDKVNKYSWRFGDSVYNTFVQNPVQSFNTFLDSFPASLAIEMKSECTDTFHFYIKVIGPKPYFTIQDTIGCGSLEATFFNKSRFSKYYIWQFGDSLNTNRYKSDKDSVKFTYSEPGRYHIRLIGIDTVFNPFTNTYEACNVVFPDNVFGKDSIRAVQVLPYRTTGILSKDTICIGSPLQFTSLSDSAYRYDFWDMGDSTAFDTNAPSNFNYIYKKEGSYLVKLNPRYIDTLHNTCRDSASKTIVVMGVKADFDIDPSSLSPLFKFNNKSLPGSAGLNWDFGQPSSSNNTSTAQNPQKDYGKDTGSFTVCLIASIQYGCADTICKLVFNDHLDDFGIFNVFTPGKIDGKNDVYDIIIENEELYDLKIYNRWGTLVYESDRDYDGDTGNWNGKVKNTGENCPSGTYYYIFRYSYKNTPDKIETIEGVIHLIR